MFHFICVFDSHWILVLKARLKLNVKLADDMGSVPSSLKESIKSFYFKLLNSSMQNNISDTFHNVVKRGQVLNSMVVPLRNLLKHKIFYLSLCKKGRKGSRVTSVIGSEFV